MLRLKSLHLKNFGAFKGEQSFCLPDTEGVAVFYGENMRGKTTLLNAFRFALFGKILGRGRRAVSFHEMVNWEARVDGVQSFEVRLKMTYAGADYRLTRTCRPKSGAGSPAVHEDYLTDYYLERDGHILPAQQAALELERILPEQIARFFLFDGELLQEYEDLLHGESDMGPKISQAIERILGLPTLTKSRDNLKAALDRAEKRVALAAQRDQKTREYGNQLQSLVEEHEVLTSDLFRHEKELEYLRAQKVAIENDMRRRERMASLLDKRDRLENDVHKLKPAIQKKEEAVTKAMAQAWSAILHPKLLASVASHREKETLLQASVTRAQVLQSIAGGSDSECPTCLQKISTEAQTRIRALLSESDAGKLDSEQRELSAVRRRLDALEAQIAASNPEALRLLWADLEASRRDVYSKTGEIEEIEKQITGDAEDDLRGLRREYDSVVKQIAALEDGVSATTAKIVENANYRDKIQKQLDKLAGGQMEMERRRRDLASQMHDLFKEGVEVYREELRHRVESDASRYFRMLTTEPEYAGLRINDSYGLTIIHNDGSDIPIRSASAEHVVALSLVAALQNNAQLRGPIVIDSPFGRLDGGHRSRIVEVLPKMADQVVLLVYEEELPPDRARKALKGRLRAEWALERRSARHTELIQL